MSATMRRIVEREIAAALIADGLAAGYAIAVNNGGDEDELPPSTDAEAILAAMFATDDEHLHFYKDGKRAGWVWFVYGNDGTCTSTRTASGPAGSGSSTATTAGTSSATTARGSSTSWPAPRR